MAGYLEGYGAGDERRERLWKRAGLVLLVLGVLAVAGYFLFRDGREKAQAQVFLEHLRQKRFDQAYAMWSCHAENTKCRDYPYEAFLRDWGPEGAAGKIAGMKVVKTLSCSSSYIQTLRFGEQTENLFINRADLLLSTIEFAACNPRFRP